MFSIKISNCRPELLLPWYRSYCILEELETDKNIQEPLCSIPKKIGMECGISSCLARCLFLLALCLTIQICPCFYLMVEESLSVLVYMMSHMMS
jgi:hypothetical protein